MDGHLHARDGYDAQRITKVIGVVEQQRQSHQQLRPLDQGKAGVGLCEHS